MTTVIVLSALAAALSLGAIIAVSLAVKKLNRGSSENGYEKFISELQKVNISLSATIKAYTDAQERDFDNLAKRIESSGEKERAQQEKLHDVVLNSVKSIADGNEKRITEMSNAQRESLQEIKKELKDSLEKLEKGTREELERVRKDNSEQLERIRMTVDDKLSKTLNERLDSSFKNVRESLDRLYKNLGELKSLDTAVGDLNRTLSGVKTRGNWGELSLETLLEDILTPEQFERQSTLGSRSRETVDFAVKMPGADGDFVYLPIDSKFPVEDFQRMMTALEAGNVSEYESNRREFEKRLKSEAVSIKNKYIKPPKTTDFALMYLPTESLYAEALRVPGLVEEIQRSQRVIITGPTNAAALLNSLRIGFRTLMIQKNSAEVFKILSDFRKKFYDFKDTLAAVRENLRRAGEKLDKAESSTEKIDKSLRRAERLDIDEAVEPPKLIGGESGGI